MAAVRVIAQDGVRGLRVEKLAAATSAWNADVAGARPLDREL